MPGQGVASPGKRLLLKQPLLVPANFVGMHFHRWPQGSPVSSAPTYGYGTVRSHDYGIAWNEIHTGPDKFQWARMDTWVETHFSSGKTLIYTIYGTPAWASSDPKVKDAYGHLGGGAPPNNLADLGNFVTALVRRYNGSGKQKIQFIEIWNEPHFLQNNRGFWWGTSKQLADVGKVIYRSAKASDPAIKILSPAFDGLPEGHLLFNTTGIAAGLREFFQTKDASGDKATRWFDAVAVHTYDATLSDPTHGLEGTILQLQETLRHFKVLVPVYNTETGYLPNSLFGTSSLSEKANILRRQAAVQAALGIQALCFYSHDDEFCGNPSKHVEIASAINDIFSRLSGKSLRQVAILPDGSVEVTTNTEQFRW